MSLDPALRAILVCPEDKGELTDVPAGEGRPEPGLRCETCGRRYPIRDGIPVMLVDEAAGGPVGAEPTEGTPSDPEGAA